MDVKKALLGLSLLLLLGNGVAVADNHDSQIKSSLPGLTLLAEQGHADAQYQLALLYRNGMGVPQSDKTSIKWGIKAAEQGHARAQYGLGYQYDNGRGVQQSDKTAVK